MQLNPLWNWNKKNTEAWIFTKKALYANLHGHMAEVDQSVSDEEFEIASEDEY